MKISNQEIQYRKKIEKNIFILGYDGNLKYTPNNGGMRNPSLNEDIGVFFLGL